MCVAFPCKSLDPPTRSGICNSYTMGTSDLPDIYTRGLRDEDVYIR